LFVESIIRTSIFIDISDLDVETEKESDCKSDISDALDLYFRTIRPFVDGVDVEQERDDTITNVSVSEILSDVLKSYGATVQTVTFGLVVGVSIPLYTLDQGELAKLGGITYA
jgi:vacuolar-type H+-ATPase subunit E/Vma4